MDLVVACVGTRMPDWVAAGWETYRRRMPPHLPLSLVELPVGGGRSRGSDSERESQDLLTRIPAQARVVALHGAARAWSTEHLAGRLDTWQMDGDPLWFLIGGADGLAAPALERAAERWSLGPATFPHMLVRVLVAEQLYRAWTIASGHPYHR